MSTSIKQGTTNNAKRLLFPLLAGLLTLPLSAQAEDTTPLAVKTDREAIETFYQILNNSGDDSNLETRASEVVAKNWNSEPDTLGGDGLKGFVFTFIRYHQAIPDMLFTPQEILKVGPHRYVVRSMASGTVMSDFLGIGDRFKPGFHFNVMTIEIHTLKNGKFVKTYHVEDWKSAIEQLIRQRQ